jgi:hypothetical protein
MYTVVNGVLLVYCSKTLASLHDSQWCVLPDFRHLMCIKHITCICVWMQMS